jgi:hypothetical protein
MASSIHDNLLIGYEVHCETREIRIQTEFRDRGEPFERVLVVFTGVEAYDFKYDCFGNIIFDIEEIPPESVISDRIAEFQEGNRYGWPPFWKNSLDEVQRYLREHSVRGFELSSSYGMSGWILAREMTFVSEADQL